MLLTKPGAGSEKHHNCVARASAQQVGRHYCVVRAVDVAQLCLQDADGLEPELSGRQRRNVACRAGSKISNALSLSPLSL